MSAVRALLHDQIERLWGRGETALVARNYAVNVVDHMPVPGQPTGRDALAAVVAGFRAGLPDLRLVLDGTAVAGELGADWWTLTGTNTAPLFGRSATGRAVHIRGVDMIRVANGQVAELWHAEDMATFEAQLAGAGPPASFPDRHALERMLAEAASDVTVEVLATVADGDARAERWRASGVHDRGTLLGCAPTGARFAVNGFDVRRGAVTVLHVAELAQLGAQLSEAGMSLFRGPHRATMQTHAGRLA